MFRYGLFRCFGGLFGGNIFIGIISSIIHAALAIVFIVAIILIVRHLHRNSPVRNKNDALEILKMRLARGEITMDEYNRLRDEILK